MANGNTSTRVALVLALALGLIAAVGAVFMRGSAVAPPAVESPAAAPATALGTMGENLNATVWVQTAAEYVGAAEQSYVLARVMLDRALEDPDWTAALEQQQAGGYRDLPPAVILDVDETVLDNSPYQSRQLLDGFEFSTATWHDWVREAQARPVPGALAFTRYAAERGVAVYYVTNRRAEVEEPTRVNLEEHGFPMGEGADFVLTRDEQEDWGGDKGTRRRVVADSHRILLLVGDNFGDFVSDVNASVLRRAEMAQEYADFWGTRWIVLPNPQYGSWDGALIDFNYGLSLAEKRERKLAALNTAR
jgi:acid phosphatase